MTATELLAVTREKFPGRRFAASRSGMVIGEFNQAAGKFLPAAGMLISGEWANMPPILANGKPLVADEDWLE